MPKISSCQKQKNKIARLEYEIQCILGRKTLTEQAVVTTQYKMMYDMEDIVFSGTVVDLDFKGSPRKEFVFQGIYPKIKK